MIALGFAHLVVRQLNDRIVPLMDLHLLKPDEAEPRKLVLPFINLPLFAQLQATARKGGDEFRNEIFATFVNSKLVSDYAFPQTLPGKWGSLAANNK